MALEIGSRLAHYNVTALIGEGGMGQVYQATDTKLKRQVALKILPETFSADPERLARFQREAEVLASLNHPNIAAIYGLEEAGDTRALVLELVEGPTLADRIKQGPIPLDEALPIAKQIAEALEAAHEAGVIHRDLKPANIKVREDGTVKVLDFGLAKALDPNLDGDPSQSPTLTAAATQMGVIMGTAAYMSPEQARGKTVDKRADIWAFGVVLLEMLTGRAVFEGEDVSMTLSSVLQREPDWSHLPSSVSPSLSVFLHRCLEKDPKQRVHDVADVRLAMEGAFETGVSRPSTQAVAASRSTGQLALPWVAGFTLAVIASVAVWSVMRPAALHVVRFAVSPDEALPLYIALRSPDVAISPAGDQIAYLTESGAIAGGQLHVRPLDQLTSETLVATGAINSPFFSPDGASVGFYDNRPNAPVLQRVSVRGGPTSTICELPALLFGASWGDDGTIVFGTIDGESGLWRVPAVGGEPTLLTTPNPEQGEVDHVWPEMLPGGHAVLFTIMASAINESQIAVLSLDTGEQKVLVRGGSFPRYAPTGHLLYGAQGNLWAVGFDPDRLETHGDPVPVLEGVLMKDEGVVNVGLSENGSLIYVPSDAGMTGAARTLVWVDREGREEALRAPPAPYESPRISPDGRAVAVEVRDPGNTDVMVYDLARETPTRLTFDPSVDGWPLWSPDSQRILFTSNRDGAPNIYAMAANGTGQPARVTTGETNHFPQSWSGDGQTLVIMADIPTDLRVVSIGADSPPEGLIEFDAAEFYPEVSPDGRWMAYQSNESGLFQVYVRPFPNVDDGKWQISRDAGVEPVWGPDGRELFFRRGIAGEMLVVAVDTEPVFAWGNPEVLFAAPYRSGTAGRNRPWDVAADGRFLMIKEGGPEAGGPSQINVVLNWHEELKRLVPVD